MPLYEYHCKNCGENIELLQKHSDAPEKTCPHCHKDTLQKQISAGNFQLKGTGWYETDFKNAKKKPDETKKAAETKPESPAKTDTAITKKTD
ncbi:MAG TPA: zinc ribbon domain-containing protein [Coxiellaceae bacterium]|nr:MAG: hypothetical protein A3E81_00755 [Gammaproteobacteria bacterium RIFCSPHIGHO2_12_FULL_36_30]HLB56689.1 zinc ribbon domain-containing protein [Coxiellaceae bacterium]